jgi:ferredoxin-fold anticodon binding domain-containing protein
MPAERSNFSITDLSKMIGEIWKGRSKEEKGMGLQYRVCSHRRDCERAMKESEASLLRGTSKKRK